MQEIEYQEEIMNSLEIVQLVKGLSEGQEFWAYMVMDPLKQEEYMARVEKNEIFDLTEYGDVLESGFGSEPPEEIRRIMAEEFGFQDDFAEQVFKALEQITETEE